MDKQSIFHKTKSHYAYAVDAQNIQLQLRSKRNDLQEVFFITSHEDGWIPDKQGKYHWKKQKIKMTKRFSTQLFDYWQVTFSAKELKIRYGFLLNDGQEEILFIERGFFNPEDPFIQNDINSYFSFPYVHEVDIFKAPSWVKDTVWYQIFPDRFYKEDIMNDEKTLAAWSQNKKGLGEYKFYGGTLGGIRQKLNYLADLGISGIYLTPIFQSPTSHKYDTEDYFQIDPHFGTKEEFRQLVAEAHSLGIRIMLDAVFNHIGASSYQFQDVLKNGQSSVYYD